MEQHKRREATKTPASAPAPESDKGAGFEADLRRFLEVRAALEELKVEAAALKARLIPQIDALRGHRVEAPGGVVEVRVFTQKRLNLAELARLLEAGATTESAVWLTRQLKYLYVVVPGRVALLGNKFILRKREGGKE